MIHMLLPVSYRESKTMCHDQGIFLSGTMRERHAIVRRAALFKVLEKGNEISSKA